MSPSFVPCLLGSVAVEAVGVLPLVRLVLGAVVVALVLQSGADAAKLPARPEIRLR